MTRDEYEGRIAELKARYPYLFAAPHVSRHVAPGWMSIVSELCARIDGALTEAERPRVHFTQIREKYGSLRAYLNIAPLRVDIHGGAESARISGYIGESERPSLFKRLSPLIPAAEAESCRTCTFCGAAGRLRREDRCWVLTLCDRHCACTYDHLDAAFELATDPQRDCVPPTMEALAAALRDERMTLRVLGVLHLGMLPPAGGIAPCRLVLILTEPEGSQVCDVLGALAPRVGWPLDATTARASQRLRRSAEGRGRVVDLLTAVRLAGAETARQRKRCRHCPPAAITPHEPISGRWRTRRRTDEMGRCWS